MAEERRMHEVLFEYAVYVPIGIAASVAERLPELTERGRRLASTRVHMARLMGEFAVGHAQRRFGRLFSSDGGAADSPAARPETTPGPPSRHGPDSVAGPGTPPSPSAVPDLRIAPELIEPAAAAASLPAVESLAIPAYDTLAASQVVQRLSSLDPDELEAVRSYEAGTRGRRTILHRVAQLYAADGRASG